MPPTCILSAPVTLNFADLPANVAISASASTPGTGSIVGYAWSILGQPVGATASLSATNVVNVTLNNVTVPGTYRIGCVVENTGGEFSEQDFYAAPNTMPSAIFCLSVRNQYSNVVAPGLAERTQQAGGGRPTAASFF